MTTPASPASPAAPAPAPPLPPLPRPVVTIAIIALNLIAFGYELARGASAMGPSPQEMVDLGGNLPMLTLGGEWWRLGAAMFLHYGLLHIGLNMLCLWQGRIVEIAYGRGAFAAIYVVAGLLGGVATAVHGQNVVSAGASGAVFGVYGAFASFLWLRRDVFPPAVWHQIVRQMATFLGMNVLFGMSVSGIDMSAHAGGLCAGAAAGALLLVRPRPGARRASTGRVVAIAAAGLALVAAALIARHGAGEPPEVVVLRDVAAVDERAITAWNAILAEAQGGKLDDAATADRIEREVLGPWRPVRARVDAFTPPPRLDGLFAAERAYFAAREAAWTAMVQALRLPRDQQAARLDDYKAKAEAAERAGAALRELIKHP